MTLLPFRIMNSASRKIVFLLCFGLFPGGLAAGQSASASQETQRIEKLETLADIWGKLWLFHPNVVNSDVDWESILIRTIPEVERTQTLDEFVNVLNGSLFAPLADATLIARRNLPTEDVERSPLRLALPRRLTLLRGMTLSG